MEEASHLHPRGVQGRPSVVITTAEAEFTAEFAFAVAICFSYLASGDAETYNLWIGGV